MIASSALSDKALYRTGPEYADTFGPEVASLCSNAGYVPDHEQLLGLNALFGISTEGVSSSFEFALVGPRQNLKTGLLKMAVLGWLFVTDQELITWSAHEMSTTHEAFRDLKALIEGYGPFRRRLAPGPSNGIFEGNGKEMIELASGQRIKFKARTKVGGRGLSGDKVVLDESMYLQAAHLGSLLPTLAVRPDPQVAYAGSAGLLISDEWRAVRDRGRRGGDPGLTYVEYGTPAGGCLLPDCDHARDPRPPGCALDDEDKRRQANPSYGERLPPERLEAFRRSMPPEEFAREFFSWWEEPGTPDAAFGKGNWEACAGDPPQGIPMGAFGIAASMDMLRGAITAAAVDGDLIHLKPLQHGPGTQWIVERAKQIQTLHGVPAVIDKRGPAAPLIPHLERAGVKLLQLDTAEVLDACASLLDKVRERKIRHARYPELEDAVQGAVRRLVGDRWAWGRKLSSSDISPLEAGTFAAHVASIPAQPTNVWGFYG